jgi:hypothetical protein
VYLPPDYTYQPSAQGVADFPVILRTRGHQTMSDDLFKAGGRTSGYQEKQAYTGFLGWHTSSCRVATIVNVPAACTRHFACASC